MGAFPSAGGLYRLESRCCIDGFGCYILLYTPQNELWAQQSAAFFTVASLFYNVTNTNAKHS